MVRRLDDRQLAQDLDRALRENRNLEGVRREREAAERARLTAGMSTMGIGGGAQAVAGSSGTSNTAIAGSSSSSSPVSTFASRQKSATTASSRQKFSDCIICGDAYLLNANCLLPCGHHACSPCLRELFLLATKEESQNPASCCSRALPEHFEWYAKLTVNEGAAYRLACKEFAVKNRLYCSTKTCSTFLGSADGAKRFAVCSKCGASTSSACKAPQHLSTQACAADSDDNAASKLATQLSGTRCARCKRVVVRPGGCPNVVCRCGAQLSIAVDAGN